MGKHNNVQSKSSRILPSIYTFITLLPAIQWSLHDVGQWKCTCVFDKDCTLSVEIGRRPLTLGHNPSIYFNLHLYSMKGDLKAMCIPYVTKHAVRRRWWRNTDPPPIGLRNPIHISLILCKLSNKFVYIICTDILFYPQQIFQVLTQLQFVQCVGWHLWD